jgi:hypothetical protein
VANQRSDKSNQGEEDKPNPNKPSAAAQMAGTVSDEALVSGRTPGAGDAARGAGTLPAARAATEGASPVGEGEATQTT